MLRNGIVTLLWALGDHGNQWSFKEGNMAQQQGGNTCSESSKCEFSTAFVRPKGLHRKALGVSLLWSSSKVNAGHKEWDSFQFVFLLLWLYGAGRALGPPAASLSAGVQADPACCLAQCALAEFYDLWTEMLCLLILLLKCDSNPDANFNSF